MVTKEASISCQPNVVGTKTSDSVIEAAGITGLGENVDVELWDEALKMAPGLSFTQLLT